MGPGAASRTEPTFKLGERGLAIPMELHKINRARLCSRIQNLWAQSNPPTPQLNEVYILLQGGSLVAHGGSDADTVFRQESYFHWAFGGLESDCYGAINIANLRSILFVPKISEEAAVYVGDPPSLMTIQNMYAVDEAYHTTDIAQFFEEHKASLLLTLHGLNTDSGEYTMEAKFPGIEKFKVDSKILHHEISECRLIKSALELEVIRYAVETSSAAHRHLMRAVKPGMYQFQVESMFMHYCYFYGGMRHCAYTCIGASGCDCAILHYGHAGAPNERLINDGDMCLFDMGGEYYCYCSDITCSYPVNGRFTADQKMVYEGVLAATRAVIDCLRPGVSWTKMHRLSESIILQHLLNGGLLTGSVDEMMEHNLGSVFMPHGLGHLMGCDVHDVGGYNKVRIEEDVLVTETGCEVLSKVPRTVKEIEDWMSREHTDYDEIK